MTGRVTVPFSFQEFDPRYLESLSHDYSKFDGNGDGRLNQDEFVRWLIAGGTKEKVAKNLFYVADSNNDGSISLDEFKKFAKTQQDMIVKGETEKYAKLIYDSVKSHNNHSGGLNKKEFLKFMELMNIPVGFFSKGKVFRQYDSDGSGTVDFDEIMHKINFRNEQLTRADD
ncbi:hypothetical protein M9Y10_005967 [Tritrichomonas musculus]|uniref:EF-hand domain-containing protein n=1 Tax=Tritrichomonas musculus TaxID=1915356 RepID=A0ABR2JDY2_9EUKA